MLFCTIVFFASLIFFIRRPASHLRGFCAACEQPGRRHTQPPQHLPWPQYPSQPQPTSRTVKRAMWPPRQARQASRGAKVVGDVDGLNKRGAHLYLEGESDFMDSDDDDETSKYNTFVVTGIRNAGTRIVMEQPENGDLVGSIGVSVRVLCRCEDDDADAACRAARPAPNVVPRPAA